MIEEIIKIIKENFTNCAPALNIIFNENSHLKDHLKNLSIFELLSDDEM